MQRTIFDTEHEDFRQMVGNFLAAEAVPHFADWERARAVPRSFFRRLGELDIMGMTIPEEYGGGGETSYRYGAVLTEETARAVISTGALRCHLDVVLPYFLAYADSAQRARWFPMLASGELFTAIAMTEPGTGSDLAGIRTRARRDGDHYVLNGTKTFITGGILADLVIVVARTSDGPDRRDGLSLLVVEDGMPGFVKGRNLDKIGLHVQDTAELFFEDVPVPVENRLGEEGQAFTQLTHNLPKERLGIAVSAVANSHTMLTLTVDHVKNRTVFDQPLSSFQNTKFELASVATELEAAQQLVDRGIADLDDGELSPVDAAKIKLFCTELQGRVADRCLQLFGGYGYMAEYPIGRLWADARVTRIYGGTSEMMRAIIAKSLGL
jgi:acyl-CoA dehydrogenase